MLKKKTLYILSLWYMYFIYQDSTLQVEMKSAKSAIFLESQ